MANEPIITITGNLVADPELKYVGNGTPVAEFTIASTPRNLNRQTNEWEDGEAVFYKCSVWREYAENVTESLSKGMRVVVTGKLQVRSFERKDGSKGTSIELLVDEVGPSLRYATAVVTRAGSKGGNSPARSSNARTGDQWATDPAGNLSALMGASDAPF